MKNDLTNNENSNQNINNNEKEINFTQTKFMLISLYL